MNKHRFFSISFVRIRYKNMWLNRCASKIWGRSVRSYLKNSTPSPWKCRKSTSSTTFCATGVWGLIKLCNRELGSFEFILSFFDNFNHYEDVFNFVSFCWNSLQFLVSSAIPMIIARQRKRIDFIFHAFLHFCHGKMSRTNSKPKKHNFFFLPLVS